MAPKRKLKIDKTNKKYDWATTMTIMATVVSSLSALFAAYSTVISRNQYLLSVNQFEEQRRKDVIKELDDKIEAQRRDEEFREHINVLKSQAKSLEEQSVLTKQLNIQNRYLNKGLLQIDEIRFIEWARFNSPEEAIVVNWGEGYSPDLSEDLSNHTVSVLNAIDLVDLKDIKRFAGFNPQITTPNAEKEVLRVAQKSNIDNYLLVRKYRIWIKILNSGKSPVVLTSFKISYKQKESDQYTKISDSQVSNLVLSPTAGVNRQPEFYGPISSSIEILLLKIEIEYEDFNKKRNPVEFNIMYDRSIPEKWVYL